tara:strand:- start:727 stop:1068 length:342 start_codon:yes stop_codon:yes gene_type:complete
MLQNKLLCFDWTLCDKTYSTFRSLDIDTGINSSDIQETEKCLRVFGTKKQIKEVEKIYDIDEVYEFKVEKEGSYWYKIYNDPEKENARVSQKLREYKKLYQLNNNEVLILRIK